MALIERETPELRKLRRLTQPDPLPVAPSFPELPSPLPPPEPEKESIFKQFGQAVLDVPIGGTASLRQLGQGLSSLGAVTQIARAGVETPVFEALAEQNPALAAGRAALQAFRKPEEEREDFRPTLNPIDAFTQLVKLEEAEPFLAQILGGVVTDPFVAVGAGKAAAKVGKEVVEQAPGLVSIIAREQTGGIKVPNIVNRVVDDILNRGGSAADTKVVAGLDDELKGVANLITTPELTAQQQSIAKLETALELSRKLRSQLTVKQSKERGRRFAAANDELEARRLENPELGEADFAAIRAKFGGGELASRQSDRLVGLIDETDVNNLTNTIISTDVLRPGEAGIASRVRAQGALRKVLTGEIPQPGEINTLNRIFFPKAVKPPKGKDWLGMLGEIANFSRVLSTSIFDQSLWFRQGLIFDAAHPNISRKAMADSAKAFLSPKHFDAVVARQNADPAKARALKTGKVQFTDIDGPLNAQEERIMSTWLANIPEPESKALRTLLFPAKVVSKFGFKPTQRGASSFINEQRLGVWKVGEDALTKIGKTPEANPGDFALWGDFVNIGTGRGPIPKSMERFAPILNGFLFSARLLSSRIVLPFAPVRGAWWGANSASFATRRMIAKDLAKFYGVMTTVMGVAVMMGLEVETDCRSSDFGQIRVKGTSTRFDVWGGLRPVAVGMCRVVKGETKRVGSGDVVPLGRIDGLEKFAESKLAPFAGFGNAVRKGEDFLGNPVETPAQITKEFLEIHVPLLSREVIEAMQEDGLLYSGLSGGAGFIGFGTSSFTPVTQRLDEGAQNLFGQAFDRLSARDKNEVKQLPSVRAEIVRQQNKNKKLGTFENLQAAREDYERVVVSAEVDLMQRLADGQQGKVLREALQKTKQNMWVARQTVFDPDLESFFKLNETTEDELRGLYWSASPLQREDGTLDFNHQRMQREQVLERAEQLGIDRTVINQRSIQFEDPIIQQLMDVWNADLERLRVYWDGSTASVRARLNPERQPVWDEFVSTRSPNRKRQLKRSNPWLRKADSLRTKLRKQYRRVNPDVDEILIRWEYSVEPQSVEGQEVQEQVFGR